VPSHKKLPEISLRGATYHAPISIIFAIKDVNWCAHAYTGEKFLNFCTGQEIPGPLNSKKAVISSGDVCDRDTVQL